MRDSMTEEGRWARAARRIRSAWGALLADEAGDVPGWVLVTLMTSAIVVLLWALAGPALSGLFNQAIQSVSGF